MTTLPASSFGRWLAFLGRSCLTGSASSNRSMCHASFCRWHAPSSTCRRHVIDWSRLAAAGRCNPFDLPQLSPGSMLPISSFNLRRERPGLPSPASSRSKVSLPHDGRLPRQDERRPRGDRRPHAARSDRATRRSSSGVGLARGAKAPTRLPPTENAPIRLASEMKTHKLQPLGLLLAMVAAGCHGNMKPGTVHRGPDGDPFVWVEAGTLHFGLGRAHAAYVFDRATQTCWILVGESLDALDCCAARRVPAVRGIVTWESDSSCSDAASAPTSPTTVGPGEGSGPADDRQGRASPW